MAPETPGWPTQGVSWVLAFLRDRGLPFLNGADDAKLRTLALGIRAAMRRTAAGPHRHVRAHGSAGEVRFARLGDDDHVRVLTDNREAFLAKGGFKA